MSKSLKLYITEILSFTIFFVAYFILLSPLLLIEFISILNILALTFILLYLAIMYGSIKTWWKYRGKFLGKSSFLYEKVNKISNKMNATNPKIIILDIPTPNAYATDALPTRPIVIFTTGLLDSLNDDELDAVIAHEISHINNYDVFYMMFLSTIMSFVRRKHNFTRQFVYSGDVLGIILFIIPFIITRINLFICRFNFFLISRVREYDADRDAAKATSPIHMKNALIKINNKMYKLEFKNQNIFYGEEQLCIAPFINSEKLFTTHPTLEDRIEEISKLE